MNWIFEPFIWHGSLDTYWPIVVQGLLVAVSLGLIGCFLVVRGMSLLGDALSHSVLPGIVAGFLIGGSLHSPWILVGATAIGLVAAYLVETVHSQSRVKEDASLAIIFTTLFAFGVVLVSSDSIVGQADLDPSCVLYGNLEFFMIDRSAIIPMAIIAAVLVGLLFIFYRHLLVCAFDPGLAISIGISTVVMHYGLMTALALTIVASFEAVGAILAVALLIMPGATARLWTDRMPTMLLLAATHAVLSTILGYWLLHPAVGNTSASGAISVAGFVLFLLSWLFTPHNGLVVRIIKRRRLRRVMAMENLVKTIDELSDQVTSASVSVSGVRAELRIPDRSYERTLLRAQKLGLLKLENQTISLTETGRAGAARLRRAHELWEQFLRQEVGLEPDHVHDAAEWIEHHLSDERIEAIDHTLHKPDGGRV